MNSNIIFSISFAVFLLMLSQASALTVSVSQSGADTDEIMKGRTFTIEASGWTGSCSQATISFTGCSSCSLSGESEQKTIASGVTSVSWTTASATQLASAQTVSASVSGGCTLDQGTSSTFDLVLPPSLSAEASTTYSSVNAGSTFPVNLNVLNSGETAARDVSIAASSGFSVSSGCAPLATIDEGQSAAQTCTVLASTAGTHTVTLTVSSSNADSAADSFSMTVNSVGGDSPGGGAPTGPSGSLPPGQAKKNTTSRKFDLVPGVGLRNNTKLLAAVEKVLAKGKLSDQARENLLRLSASIASDTEITKTMESSKAKSNITLRIKYAGNRKVMKFMLYEKLPKAFASSAGSISVSAAGATYEVVEADPEFVFTFPEIASGQEAAITFSVNSEVPVSALEATATEVYGEVYEGLTEEQVCGAGEARCVGNLLQRCAADQRSWEAARTCEYGCESGACKPAPAASSQIDWQQLMALMPYSALALVIVVLVLAASLLVRRRKGKFKPPKPMPQMRERPENLP